jgi:SAM-dependent methyltransferase
MSSDGAQTFRTSPAAYDGHVGRYGRELAQGLIELADVRRGDRVLDVGCGTGMLTLELAAVVGADRVTAIDPSERFVEACRERVPGSDVRLGGAEALAFADASFDRTLAQLVVNFMSDAPAGVHEMLRVTRPGGTVAACVWDYAGQMTLLRTFWDAATALDPAAKDLDEGVSMQYCQPDSLRALWDGVGLHGVTTAELHPSVRYASFDELWAPFTAGVAPSGAYTAALSPADQEALRQEFLRRLGAPAASFVLTARAWAVVGHS